MWRALKHQIEAACLLVLAYCFLTFADKQLQQKVAELKCSFHMRIHLLIGCYGGDCKQLL